MLDFDVVPEQVEMGCVVIGADENHHLMTERLNHFITTLAPELSVPICALEHPTESEYERGLKWARAHLSSRSGRALIVLVMPERTLTWDMKTLGVTTWHSVRIGIRRELGKAGLLPHA